MTPMIPADHQPIINSDSYPHHIPEQHPHHIPEQHRQQSTNRPNKMYTPVRNTVDYPESSDSTENLQAQDTQRHEVRVLPDRDYMNRQFRFNITDYTPQNNTIHRKPKKPSTPTPIQITTPTTTTENPFALFAPMNQMKSQSSKRRKSQKEDIPDYMRFRRDISHIQKIPGRGHKKVYSPNNIQTITKATEKNRGRREVYESMETTSMTTTTEIPTTLTEVTSTMDTTTDFASSVGTSTVNPFDSDTSTLSNSLESDEFPAEEIEHFKYIIGKPIDFSKMKPFNEKKSNHFQKYLISRLIKQRKKTDKKKVKEIETNDLQPFEDAVTATPTFTSTFSDLTNQNLMNEIIPKMEPIVKTKVLKPNPPRLRRHFGENPKPLLAKLKKLREKRSVTSDQYSLENEIFGRDSLEKPHFYNIKKVIEIVEPIEVLTTATPGEEKKDILDESNSSDDSISWGDEDEDDEGKKIIIVARHPIGMGPSNGKIMGGNQLVENFLKTISSVLDRVHRRLSGYFTAL